MEIQHYPNIVDNQLIMFQQISFITLWLSTQPILLWVTDNPIVTSTKALYYTTKIKASWGDH